MAIDDREAEHDEAEGRKRVARDEQRRAQRGRRRHGPGIAGPDQQAQVGDDERDAERDQHLSLHIAGKAAQDEALEQDADETDAEAGSQHGEPEVAAEIHDGRAEIGAEHEECAMGEIGNAHQPEGEREARRQQEQQAAEGDAVERLDDPELQRFRENEIEGAVEHRLIDVAMSRIVPCRGAPCGRPHDDDANRAATRAAPTNVSMESRSARPHSHSRFFAGG